MRKVLSKTLGFVLSIAMIMSSISVPAFATEIEEGEIAIETEVEEQEEEIIIEDAVYEEPAEEELIEKEIITEDEIAEDEFVEEFVEEPLEDDEVLEGEGIPEEGEDNTMDLTTTEFGQILFYINGTAQTEGLEFAENTVDEGWYLLSNGGDIKFKLTTNLTGKKIASFLYQAVGTATPSLFDDPDEDGYYTIPAACNTGSNIVINLTSADILGKIALMFDGSDSKDALVFEEDGAVDADWDIIENKDIVFTIADGKIPQGCTIKEFSYSVNGQDPKELIPDADGKYTIPDDDIPGSSEGGIQILLTIKRPELKKVTLKDKAGKTVGNTITLPVGTDGVYTIEKDKPESQDEISIQYMGDAANFDAQLNTDKDKVTVLISEVPGANVTGGFKIVNESVLVDGEPAVLASFNVKGTNPAWTGKKVSASVASITDVSVNIEIKPFTVIGDDLYNDSYYYKVEWTGDHKEIKSGLVYDPYELYVKPEKDGNTVATIYPFIDGKGDAVKTPGLGTAYKFNVNVSIVMKKSTASGATPSSSNVFLESQALTLATATKAPHYAEKISIKKGKTDVLAGQKLVPIGTVTFGKNDTFITNVDWDIKTLIAPDGISIGTADNPVPLNDDRLYGVSICKNSSGISLDNTIYVSADSKALPGKYTAILATYGKDRSGYSPEAKITFTVKNSITDLELTVPNKILKTANKNATSKTSVSAVSKTYPKISDEVFTVTTIKNPKVNYEVGIPSGTKIDKVEGLSVDKKGVITIDKGFQVVEGKTYTLRVNAIDYEDNYTSDSAEFTIVEEATKVKSLEVYLDKGEEEDNRYLPVTSKSTVPFDMLEDNIRFAVKGADGSYIVGGDGKDGHDAPVKIDTVLKYKTYGDNGLMLDCNYDNPMRQIYIPKKITFTVMSIDGSKAKLTFKVGYSRSGESFNGLDVIRYGDVETEGDILCAENEKTTYEVPAKWGTYPMISLSVTEDDAMLGQLGEWAVLKPCISGTISVKGAKVIMDYGKGVMEKYYSAMYGSMSIDFACEKNQSIIIQPTKPEVTVTVTRQVYDNNLNIKTIKDQYTIKCAAPDKTLPKAPKIKSVMLGTPTSTPGEYTYEKLPLGRKYQTDQIIEFKLDKPLTLPNGVNPKGVYITLSTFITRSQAGITIKNMPDYLDMDKSPDQAGAAYYSVDEDGKNPCVRLVKSSRWQDMLTNPKLDISLQYYYLKDGVKTYITQDASKGTAKFSTYKKSFKIDGTQTLKFNIGEGENPASVVSAAIKGKGSNVASVEIKELFNYNNKGQYNDFTTIFENEEGYLGVKGGALTTLKTEALAAKNKIPAARTGYVLCTVTYADGTKEDVMSKVTVKFAK